MLTPEDLFSGKRDPLPPRIILEQFANQPEIIERYGIGLVMTAEQSGRLDCFEWIFQYLDLKNKLEISIGDFTNFIKENYCLFKDTFVLYVNSYGEPVHMAVVHKGDIVISKWGTNGPVYMHDKHMIPRCYGELYEPEKAKNN